MVTGGSQSRLLHQRAVAQEYQDSARKTGASERIAIYWLVIATALAIGNALIPN